MPMRDEFIERAVRQLAAALARLTGLQSAAEQRLNAIEEIRGQVSDLYPAFLGTSAALVDMLGIDDLLGVISSAGYVDGERAYLLSALLEAEAEALAAESELPGSSGQVERADRVDHLKERALALMLEAGATGLGEKDIRERASRLSAALPPERLGGRYWERLHRCEAGQGDFAAAEDALFEWLAASPEEREGVERHGLAFYRQLEALEDSDLERGGLPRSEIEEGRADLLESLARV